MKKILLILLTLSLLISSVSCNAPTPPLTTSDTIPLESLPSPIKQEEFAQYISSNNIVLPSDFVTFENMHALGFSTYAIDPFCFFIDDDKVLMKYTYKAPSYESITVYHKMDSSFISWTDKSIKILNFNSREYLSYCDEDDGWVMYYCQDLIYLYYNGKLDQIIWNRGDICFKIVFSYLHPSDNEAFRQFLNKSKIEAGKEMINAVIPIASPAPAT